MMMKVRLLDTNDDMQFGQGVANFTQNTPEGVAQVVKTRLGLWLGEWFIDITDGTPWTQGVLGVGTRQKIEPTLRQRILGTQGVKSIDVFSLSIDPDDRRVSVQVTITTAYGAVTVTQEVR